MGPSRVLPDAWTVLLGPGDRILPIERLLYALGSGAGGLVISRLSDVDGLLAAHGPVGRALLDADRLASEDIGIVRRFLERNRGWVLHLTGSSPRDGAASVLLRIPHVEWHYWPIDLDQLAVLGRPPLVGSEGQSSPAATYAASAESPGTARALEESTAGSVRGRVLSREQAIPLSRDPELAQVEAILRTAPGRYPPGGPSGPRPGAEASPGPAPTAPRQTQNPTPRSGVEGSGPPAADPFQEPFDEEGPEQGPSAGLLPIEDALAADPFAEDSEFGAKAPSDVLNPAHPREERLSALHGEDPFGQDPTLADQARPFDEGEDPEDPFGSSLPHAGEESGADAAAKELSLAEDSLASDEPRQDEQELGAELPEALLEALGEEPQMLPDLVGSEEPKTSDSKSKSASADAGPLSDDGTQDLQQTLPGFYRAQVADLADLATRMHLSFSALRDEEGAASSAFSPLGQLEAEVVRLVMFTRTLGYIAAPPPPGEQDLDLSILLREQISMRVGNADGPRYLFRGVENLLVRSDKKLLVQAFDALLAIAAECTGAGSVVRVASRFMPDGERANKGFATVEISFDAGPLAGIEVEKLREPYALRRIAPRFDVGPNAVAAAEGILRGQGGALQIQCPEDGRLRLRVTLPAQGEPATD